MQLAYRVPSQLRYPRQFFVQFRRCKTLAERKWLLRRWREMTQDASGQPWVW